MGDNFPQTLPKKGPNFSLDSIDPICICALRLSFENRDEHLFYRADNFSTIILIFWGLCILSCEMSSMKEICLKRLFPPPPLNHMLQFPNSFPSLPELVMTILFKTQGFSPPFSSTSDGFFVGHVFLWFVYFFRNTWFLSSQSFFPPNSAACWRRGVLRSETKKVHVAGCDERKKDVS